MSNADDVVTQTKNAIEEFRPEQKTLQKLMTAERELLFQMSQNKAAVAFYEQKVPGFYDDLYRTIANFITEYASEHEKMDVVGLMSLLEESDLENKQRVIQELTSLYMDVHPEECTEELLNNLLETILSERKRISEEDVLKQSLEGKTELEKARIISDYNRRMMSKKEDE